MRLPTRLSHRDPEAHKGTFGHVLVLAGSIPYSGAALLCAGGALRGGAGLVTLGMAKGLALAVTRRKPAEAMLLPLAQTKSGSLSETAFPEIKRFCARIDVLAVGPGLGTDNSTQRLVRRVILDIPKPLVLDASALDALKGHLQVLQRGGRQQVRVITPHAGEMARLTGHSIPYIQNHRKDIAKDFASRYNVTVILKGNKTVVATPGGSLYINTTGNPGMARGGSGDILCGMVAAFIGQGLGPFEAAKYAAYLHGLAGDLAAKENTQLGMIASDIIEKIPAAIKASYR